MVFWKFNGNQLHTYGAVNEYCKVSYGNCIWIQIYDHGQDEKITSLIHRLLCKEVPFGNWSQTQVLVSEVRGQWVGNGE